jgi:Uma2 family endonuclease
MTTEVIEQAAETLTRRRATPEEFWALPESMLPAEYVNGEIVMAPAPTHFHQLVSRSIFRALDDFVRKGALGEVFYSPFDIILPSGAVVQPDVFFVTAQEYKRVSSSPRLRVVPALIVEILSPGSVTHDTLTKRELYEQNGVREYWVVDLGKKSIAQLLLRRKRYAFTGHESGDTIRSSVLAGFESNVGELLGPK